MQQHHAVSAKKQYHAVAAKQQHHAVAVMQQHHAVAAKQQYHAVAAMQQHHAVPAKQQHQATISAAKKNKEFWKQLFAFSKATKLRPNTREDLKRKPKPKEYICLICHHELAMKTKWYGDHHWAEQHKRSRLVAPATGDHV